MKAWRSRAQISLIVRHGSREQPSNLEFERWSSASGAHDHVTPAATRAIADAQLVARCTTYIKLVGRTYSLQGILRIGINRRDWPGRARDGGRVALISSGDAGVHGMARLNLPGARACY